MAGTVGCNIAAAVLDVFTFTLLIPFLDKLFNQPSRETGISQLLANLAYGVTTPAPPAPAQ